MTTTEAAEVLGYSKASHVTEAIRNGRLRAKRIKTVPGDWGHSRWGYRYEISAAQLARFEKNFPPDGRRKLRKTLEKTKR